MPHRISQYDERPAPSTDVVHVVRTNAELKALNLSFYTLCKLSDLLMCVDPQTCLEHRLARDPACKGELTLDRLGNFISFR